MERNDLKRVLAMAIQDVLGPRQDRGARLDAGRDLQELLGAAHHWVGECLGQIDSEVSFEPGLRRHLRALDERLPPVESGGTAGVRLRMELPDEARTVPLCRRLTRAALQELAIDPRRADDIELALSEATGNVIQHAYRQPGHRYVVEIEIYPDRLRLVVSDHGSGCDRVRRGEPDLEQPSGRGLWLIEQLADAMTVSHERGGGCHLEAVFAFPQRPDRVPPEAVLDKGGAGSGREFLYR